jgi:hypothetical protein
MGRVYNKINEEDVRGFKEPEKFMESYNELVDKLNDQIVRLESLQEEFKKRSGDSGTWQTDKEYMEKFRPMFASHAEMYDELMSMQEDLIIKNAPEEIKEQLGIDTGDGRDDV